MSHTEAMDQVAYLKEHNIISADMLAMTYEIMLYSNDAHLGNVITFDFHQTNAGLIRAHLDVQIFQPLNNGSSNAESFLRIGVEGAFFIALLFSLGGMLLTCRAKCRSLFSYKLNEFNMKDFVGLFTLASGTAIMVISGNLLYGAEYHYQERFNVPPKNYDEYVHWVNNAALLASFRMALGVFVVGQMLNLLVVAQSILPSLGILFRTIEKSMADIFVFTTITLLIFAVFVVIVFVSFGEHNYNFASIGRSMLACF